MPADDLPGLYGNIISLTRSRDLFVILAYFTAINLGNRKKVPAGPGPIKLYKKNFKIKLDFLENV